MAYWRGQLDLAIPKAVYDAIPLARKLAFRDEVRALKALAVKINEGQPNEEMTVTAQWHLCRHDEGLLCGELQDI
uniref:Uncharacterized protein n=1 Tax=viral metagenome TaxID=1070528 RepID=A0A6M3KLZ2_9ZZZZ